MESEEGAGKALLKKLGRDWETAWLQCEVPAMFESIEKEVDGAIKAHMSWKKHLDDALKNKTSHLSVEQARNYSTCSFGIWMHSEDAPEGVRRSVEHSSIPRLHREFHNCAASLLEFALEAKAQGDAEYVLLLSAYEQSSTALIRALLEWKDAGVRALLVRMSLETATDDL